MRITWLHGRSGDASWRARPESSSSSRHGDTRHCRGRVMVMPETGRGFPYHIWVNKDLDLNWISLSHFQLVSWESKNPKYLLTTMVSGSAGRKSGSVGELTARIRRLTADVNTRTANSHISAIFTVARLMLWRGLCLDIRSWTRRAQCTMQASSS